MSKALSKYEYAIRQMEKFQARKDVMVERLERLYRGRGIDEVSVQYWIDKDVEVGKCTSKIVRWAAIAAAYGPAMILEQMGSNAHGQEPKQPPTSSG